MKTYIKVLKTKREISELMVRPLALNIPSDYLNRVIEKTMAVPGRKFVIEARKATDLDIVPFINNTYFIRYELN